ncbi:MAG: lipoate--protein ligase [Clostridia bacterium]|nr:lipoate--protein ligase [Clostridia bacterium]
MKTQIYISNSYNPYFNLALEEMLFRNLPKDTVILYLWQNQNTVVIGKSQNAWKECRVSQLEADGGFLARRTSGGGAVFHDLGNLCYTFLAGEELYDLERQLKVILEAVSSVGIPAHFTGRNDICTEDGRKFSGNAFRHTAGKGLMHGTILMDTDGTKMARYLQVSKAKMEAKGVNSVRSRVVNLIELNPEITADKMREALIAAFRAEYPSECPTEPIHVGLQESCQILETPEFEAFPALVEYFGSWDFRLGETPTFQAELERKFPWGLVQLAFHTSGGVIQEVRVWTDAMDADLGAYIEGALNGKMLDFPTLCVAIDTACRKLALDTPMLADPEVVCRDLQEMVGEMV